jgi:hypothetical protein
MLKLPSSLTNITPKETLQQHPSFENYVVDKLNVYATCKETSIHANEPPHWQSNWIFRTAGSFDLGVRSLKLDPTMELRDEHDTRSMFEASLVPSVGPLEAQTANKLISLKTPMALAELFEEFEVNGLFDYEPSVETKGSLWWHYGLISWLEQKGYAVAGSTSDFLQWLAIRCIDLKARSGSCGQGTEEVDLVLSARGNFTRGER